MYIYIYIYIYIYLVNTGMPARYTCVTKVPAVICSSLVQSSASVKLEPVATWR